MIDYTNRGKRIVVKRYTKTLTHTFQGGEQGVLLGETPTGIDDRIVASIQWDGGDFGPLFSEEIEVIEPCLIPSSPIVK